MSAAAQALIRLSLDAAQFTRGLADAEGSARRSVSSISGLFEGAGKYIAAFATAGAGAALASSIQSAANYADEMGKLAQRAGATTEAISELAYAANLSNVDNETLAEGLRKLGSDADDGGKKLALLGVGLTDSSGAAKTSAQLLLDVADVIEGIEDPAKRAAVAVKLFGDGVGPKLIPLLAGGAAGLRDAADEASRFGKVITDEASAKAGEFNDNLTRLKEAASGFSQQMAGPVIKSLATASTYFIAVAKDVGIAQAALISFGAVVARTLGVDDLGGLQSQARANTNALALTVKQIETFQRFADRGVAGAAERVASLREQYTLLQRSGAQVSASLKAMAGDIESQSSPQPSTRDKPNLPDQPPKPLNPPKKPPKDLYAEDMRKFMEDEDAYREKLFQKRLDDEAKAELDHKQYLKTFDDANFAYLADRNNKRLADEADAQKKAIEDLADLQRKALEDVARAQEDQVRRLGDAFASTFSQAFDRGMKLGDLIKKLAFDAINIQFLTPATQALGKGLGAAVSGLFGGFRANGGPVSAGTSYVVGERGPELFTPSVSGGITPNGAGGNGMQIVYNIDARGADIGVEQRLQAALRASEQRTRAAVPGIVTASIARGGAMAKAVGRA